MSVHQTGPKNGQWKGGRTVTSDGYVLIRVGVDHHLADSRGYAYEHRLEAEKKLGRKLLPGEQVHHRKGKQQNEHANIKVARNHAEHRLFEGKRNPLRRVKDQPNPVISCACGCGATFEKFDRCNRPRRFVAGHNVGGNLGKAR